MRRKPLIDTLVEAYVRWREASVRVGETYRAGASETGSRGRVAFGLYMAALDAEEEAAVVYAMVVQLAAEFLQGEVPAAHGLGCVSRVARP